MKFLRAVIGYAIAGMIVMSVWGPLVNQMGLIGGVIAAFLIIGPLWFMNHYVGLIKQDSDTAFVDMGLAIGVCGTMLDVFSGGGIRMLINTIPTLAFVTIGAIAGGIVSGLVLKDMAKDENEQVVIVESEKRSLIKNQSKAI